MIGFEGEVEEKHEHLTKHSQERCLDGLCMLDQSETGQVNTTLTNRI